MFHEGTLTDVIYIFGILTQDLISNPGIIGDEFIIMDVMPDLTKLDLLMPTLRMKV